jgi:surfactin synthase thioesterase subunit
MASYEYEETRPLGAPITAIAMRHDLWSYPLRTDSWMAHTRERCDVVQWDGDHYAAFRSPQRLKELVRSLPSVQWRRGEVHIDVPTPRADVTEEIQS